MNTRQLLAYADLLGCEVTKSLHDAGENIRIKHPSGVSWSGTFYWGDEGSTSLLRFLNGLPWPSEDDPRVAQEGVYA